MDKIILTIAMLWLLAVSVYSQTTIEGTIRDENNREMADISVVLMHVSDSSVVAFTMSDDNGKYKIIHNGDSPANADIYLLVRYKTTNPKD